jgi:hypothetical protein
MVAAQRITNLFQKNEGKLQLNSPMESPKYGCTNFLAYHVLPREWAERGLDLFEGDVEPKTLH